MLRHRRGLSRPFMLLAAAAALVTAVTPASAAAQPSAADADQSPSSAGCANRVNDTARKLLPCIRTEDLRHHMQALQAIADANPGPDGHPSRNSGEPGYKASADYVARLMTQAGYNVTIQTYKFDYFAYTALPVLSEVSPTAHDYVVSTDFNPGQSTGTANASSLQPAGGIIIPPTPTPSSSSGCTASDFSGFVKGRIALIQRGGCNFGVKVLNAQAAGASGVIISSTRAIPAARVCSSAPCSTRRAIRSCPRFLSRSRPSRSAPTCWRSIRRRCITERRCRS